MRPRARALDTARELLTHPRRGPPLRVGRLRAVVGVGPERDGLILCGMAICVPGYVQKRRQRGRQREHKNRARAPAGGIEGSQRQGERGRVTPPCVFVLWVRRCLLLLRPQLWWRRCLLGRVANCCFCWPGRCVRATPLPHAQRPPTHVRDHARCTVAPVFGMTRCMRVCARAHIVHSSRTETAPQWLTGSPHHRDGRNTCQDLRFTP